MCTPPPGGPPSGWCSAFRSTHINFQGPLRAPPPAPDADPAALPDLGAVRWLPAFPYGSEPTEGEVVMPLFPLDSAFLPGTRQGLNIVEPRCRDRRGGAALAPQPNPPMTPSEDGGGAGQPPSPPLMFVHCFPPR